MFFILFYLTVGAAAVNLIDFENFQIEFVPTCQEFFLFNGSSDYAYFYQRNGKFELWLTQNSSSYAVYIMKNSSILLFGWAGIYAEINGQIMEPVIQEGIITYPLEFDSEQYLCDIISLTAGSIKNQHIECEPLTYKCKNKSNWLLICSSTLTISIVVCLLLYVCCWGPARSTSQCLLKNIYNKNYLFKVKTHTRLDIVKAIKKSIKMELIKQA